MPTPFLTAYLVGAFLALACLVVMHFLYERLMWQHSTKWEELGRPAFFSGLGILATFRVYRFLAKREYRELNDPVLSRLSLGVIVLLVVAVLAPVAVKAAFYFRDGVWPSPA